MYIQFGEDTCLEPDVPVTVYNPLKSSLIAVDIPVSELWERKESHDGWHTITVVTGTQL